MLPSYIHSKFKLTTLEQYQEKLPDVKLSLVLQKVSGDEDEVYYDHLETYAPRIKLEMDGEIIYFTNLQNLNEFLGTMLGIKYLTKVGIMV